MRTVALSAGEWAVETRRAAGVAPYLVPPFGAAVRRALEEADLLYVNLHGLQGQRYWYGDGYVTALSAAAIEQVDLGGVIAFVSPCWAMDAPAWPGPRGWDAARPGPMVRALLEAGCVAVVGGAKLNYSPAVDVLGRWVRKGLELGLTVGRALEFAKVRVGIEDLIRPSVATKDALQFVVVGDSGARAGRAAASTGRELLGTRGDSSRDGTEIGGDRVVSEGNMSRVGE